LPSPLAIGRALKARSQAAQAAELNPLASYGGMQAYGGWMAGTPNGAALPRPVREFMEGAFGPLSPMPPMPIDPAREDGDRPDPRRWQYPVGWNLPIGTPGTEGLKVAAFEVLRQYAKHYSVFRACLRVRKDEMLGLDWDIMPTKEAEKAMRGDMAAHKDFMERRNEALRFFKNPDPYQYDGFEDWFSAWLEDQFVTDAAAFHVAPPRVPGKGLFGTEVGALELIDGTTIRPLVDGRGGRPRPPNVAYQQYIWGVPRSDLMQVFLPEDAEEMASEIHDYRADQLLYRRLIPITNSPYGFSMVEQALVPGAIGFKRQSYLLDYYTEGSLPAAYVVPGPDVASPTQRRQLQDTLNAIAGDVGYKFKIIVLPPHSEIHDTKDVKLADGSDQVIAEQVMMVCAVEATEIAMIPGGRTSGLGGAGHAEGAAEIRKKQRSGPLAKRLKSTMLDFVLQQMCGQADMEFRFLGLEDEEDEEQKSKVRASDVAAGIISRDEARSDLSLPPWNLPLTSSPTVTTMTGPVPLDPAVEAPVPAAEPEPSEPPPSEENVAREDRDELATQDGKKPPAAKPPAAKPTTPDGGDGRAAPKPRTKLALPEPALSARHRLALVELDQLRGFARHRKAVTAFRTRHLPAGELALIAAGVQRGGVGAAIAEARERIRKAEALDPSDAALQRRSDREQRLAPVMAAVAASLGGLAAGVLSSKLATMTFVDQGANVMRDSYRQVYLAGAQDAGGTTDAHAFGADDVALGLGDDQHGYLQGLVQDLTAGMSAEALAARMELYGATLVGVYEKGYRDAMLAGDTGDDVLVATWTAMSGACRLCRDKDGKTFVADMNLPLPGDGGFGGDRVPGGGCMGGPRCRCAIVYDTVSASQASGLVSGLAA
jgi:hypothetical protein